jgi:hypothetical protein
MAAVLRERAKDPSLSPSERSLDSFTVYVSNTQEGFEVSVVPATDGTLSLGGENAHGRELIYFVRKTDYKVEYSHGTK